MTFLLKECKLHDLGDGAKARIVGQTINDKTSTVDTTVSAALFGPDGTLSKANFTFNKTRVRTVRGIYDSATETYVEEPCDKDLETKWKLHLAQAYTAVRPKLLKGYGTDYSVHNPWTEAGWVDIP